MDTKVGSLCTDGKLCRVVSIEPPDDKHPVGLVVIVGVWKGKLTAKRTVGPHRRVDGYRFARVQEGEVTCWGAA